MWNYKNFTEKEIMCKCGCAELWNKEEFGDNMPYYLKRAMDKLQELRNKWGKPIIINSAHRCIKHNKKVGGAKNSQHLKIAFDCRIKKEEQEEFIKLAQEVGFTGIGIYKNFIHIDLGKKRQWQGNY